MTPPRDNKPASVSNFLLIFLLAFPLVVQAQQQHHNNNNNANDVSFDQSLRTGKSTWPEEADTQKAEKKESVKYKRAQRPEDVSAIATLAPADHAVRDFPARSPQGLHPRQGARSLQDWEVEDVVLMATVDGNLYARDRKTGAPRWTFTSEIPMIETVYHPRNKSINGKSDPNDGYLWIVEPANEGPLYIYDPSSSLGVQRLGTTVKQVVEEWSPYSSEDPPVEYTGEKKNTIYTVDVATGNILRTFSAGYSNIYDQGNCRKTSGFGGAADEECETFSTLTLTRIEYTLAIQSRKTGEPICTIKYFEWGPNQRDRDLFRQYSATMDNRYIYSLFDGRVLALDHVDKQLTTSELMGQAKPSFRQKFVSPVAQVFDIARPANDASQDAPLIILPQPAGPPMSDDSVNGHEGGKVFVNCTESGSWYALSKNKYPMITEGASTAPCYNSDWRFTYGSIGGPMNAAAHHEALVGVHPLTFDGDLPQGVPQLPGGGEQATIDYKEQFQAEDRPADIVSPNFSFRRVESSVPMIFSTLFGLVLSLIILRRHAILDYVKVALNKTGHLPASTSKEVVEVVTPAIEQKDLFGSEEASAQILPEEQRSEEELRESTVTTTKDVSSLESAQAEQAATESSSQLELSTTDSSSAVADNSEDTVGSKKKKAHRGRRGGKKNAEKRGNTPGPDGGILESINEAANQEGKDTAIKPDAVNETVIAETKSKPGLQNLIMHTEKVLGHGSGGTFVFEGEFEGRQVAVKRMLPQYFELASQEVSLLEQSEDHPNVIRYYCRREDEHFLYIALERCQASLFDLFKEGPRGEMPDPSFKALADEINLNPKQALRQLAEGLAYLHKFRIVHRDIKPQNMLVAYPKKNNLSDYPRLVISDFGLCKTLPENASTLIGATGGAGTAGWKAPELIYAPRDLNSVNGSQHSASSLNGLQDVTSAQGVKRAVDIFSLGCLFYYVLTQGQHPFDDDEGWMQMRERNIVKNKLSLKVLEHGDADSVLTIDLLERMLANRPEDRPTAWQVLAHPFFWEAEDRLDFLTLASDRFDQEVRDPPSQVLEILEEVCEENKVIPYANSITYSAVAAHGNTHHRSPSSGSQRMTLAVPEANFLEVLDRKFVETLGKQRRYSGSKLADLLRALRNKHHHWDDMPENVKSLVGEVPEGYLRYWESKFPKLVVGVWIAVKECGLINERRFQRFYGLKN